MLVCPENRAQEGGFAPPDIASHDFADGTYGPFSSAPGNPATLTIVNDATSPSGKSVQSLEPCITACGSTRRNTSTSR